MKRFPAICGVLLVVAGCGGNDEASPTNPGTTTTPAETAEVRVYLLREGKVWPALRQVEAPEDLAAGALEELLAGTTEEENNDVGFTSAIPDRTAVDDLEIVDGVARVDFSRDLPPEALAQVVYTLTQFQRVQSVDLAEGAYALTGFERSDFEDETPAILVESPLPFEEVESLLRVTGTANTFEANFQYELTDTDGLIVDQNFVTATSGTGTRGTFDFTTDSFRVPFDGVGALIVFESSAKDGSRINLVEIPLRMKR